jgi:RNA polymerase sigma factor (sigma-70 family)
MAIFDTNAVLDLVNSYNKTKSDETAELILELCNPLMVYIINIYNTVDNDDVLQEVSIKLLASLKSYNGDKGSVHTYFSRVIRNCCITYYHKHIAKETHYDLDDETINFGVYINENVILQGLMKRNKVRFPSVECIDEITEIVYASINEGLDKGRTLVREISNKYGLSRDNSLVIYSSSLVYLRMLLYNDCNNNNNYDYLLDEFSLSGEIREVLGDEIFNKLINIFYGLIVHL